MGKLTKKIISAACCGHSTCASDPYSGILAGEVIRDCYKVIEIYLAELRNT